MVHLSPLEASREHFLIPFWISSVLYTYSILQSKNTPLGANFVFFFFFFFFFFFWKLNCSIVTRTCLLYGVKDEILYSLSLNKISVLFCSILQFHLTISNSGPELLVFRRQFFNTIIQRTNETNKIDCQNISTLEAEKRVLHDFAQTAFYLNYDLS